MDAFQRNVLFSLWGFAQHLVMIVFGEPLTLQTIPSRKLTYNYTKLSLYGYEVGDSTCIAFDVKACYDTLIALMQEDDDSHSMYEIVLGGWANTRSAIRIGKESYDLKAESNIYNVVHCSQFRKFKIKWQCGNIVVYRWKTSSEWEVFMSWHDRSYSVHYIGVSTFTLALGNWIIHNEGCHETSFWERDMELNNPAIHSSPRFIVGYPVTTALKCAYICHIDKGCCMFTYSERQQECRGYSNIAASNTSAGTQVWKRPMF